MILDIDGQRLEIGTHDLPAVDLLSGCSNRRRSGSPLAKRFAKSFDCDGQPYTPIGETG